MSVRLGHLAAFVGLGALAATAVAQTPTPAPTSTPTAAQQLAADPLNTAAPYAFIIDGDTGQRLYCKQCDEPMIPASMSKLMLYYIVFERIRDGRLKLTDELPVSEYALRTGGAGAGSDGSKMFVDVGSKVSVENLLKGAIIVSGNDACIVLAEGIAGSEQAAATEMTARAHELGFTKANFVNVTGLDQPPGQLMTASDIGTLSYKIIREFPDLYKIFSQTEFSWTTVRGKTITQPNRNPLLKELTGSDGVKTGHLSASGYGLAGSAVVDGKRRIIVLNGLASETDRRKEGPRVMRSAFVDFKTANLVKANAEVGEAQVWLGEKETVPLIATKDVAVGMHISALKRFKAEVVYTGPLKAPIKKGTIVGDLVITAPGFDQPFKVPVAAGADVNKLGFFALALKGLKGE